ncbi:MAG: AAA family ATPase, partial [bacterium]|nr:AAA family ATPase [bacterium]
AWQTVVRAVGNFIRFWWYYFSIPWLLRTLVAPWHRDYTPYRRGFAVDIFLQTLASNLVARAIGLSLRAGAVAVWVLFEIATLVSGAVYIFLWPFLLPLLAAFSLASVGAALRYRTAHLLWPMAVPLGVLSALIRAFRRHPRRALRSAGEKELALHYPDVWRRALRRLGYEGTPAAFPAERSAFLARAQLSEADVGVVAEFEAGRTWMREHRRRFWEAENLFGVSPLGRSWAYGYTVRLDAIGRELTGGRRPLPHQEPREYAREVRQIETILSRALENNALVVGEPGVGRERVVEDFAAFLRKGKLANVISHKRLIELDSRALADPRTLENALSEAAAAGNVIVVLPDFEHYVGREESLLPYLRSAAVQLIGITSFAALHDVLERSPEILKYMEKVEIKEPDLPAAAHLLLDALPLLEKRYRVLVPYPTLKHTAQRAARFIQEAPFPKKGFDLLDRALTVAAQMGQSVLTVAVVDQVLAEKTEIPIAGPAAAERELLLHLEQRLHERLINQEAAVRQIANVLRRARVDIQSPDRPVGSFLFLGPTGVGKTETAKALARLYYGSVERMLRFDMSEYQERSSISRLIGDAQTGTQGLLTTGARENPASLMLFDEIEKAHPDILNLFLQLLDDGRLTDARGRTVKFAAALIIGTSNAGSELIREALAAGRDLTALEREITDALQRQGVFRPELLNRFDGVIIFEPLKQPELEKIALLMLGDLAERLKAQQIIFVPTAALAREIATKGYNPEYGARPMRRVIQNELESALAKALLAGTLAQGMTVAPQSLAELTANTENKTVDAPARSGGADEGVATTEDAPGNGR